MRNADIFVTSWDWNFCCENACLLSFLSVWLNHRYNHTINRFLIFLHFFFLFITFFSFHLSLQHQTLYILPNIYFDCTTVHQYHRKTELYSPKEREKNWIWIILFSLSMSSIKHIQIIKQNKPNKNDYLRIHVLKIVEWQNIVSPFWCRTTVRRKKGNVIVLYRMK